MPTNTRCNRGAPPPPRAPGDGRGQPHPQGLQKGHDPARFQTSVLQTLKEDMSVASRPQRVATYSSPRDPLRHPQPPPRPCP